MTRAGTTQGFEYFTKIYIINLKSRPDRRKQMQQELSSIGISPDQVHWFDAIAPDSPGDFESIGARGCFLSHLGILEHAVEKKLKRILIFEDDVDFVADLSNRARPMLEQLNLNSWDVFYGGGRVDDVIPHNSQIAKIKFDVSIETCHFVALQGDAIERVCTYLKAQLGRPSGDPAGGPMHVDGSYSWARRELQLETYIAYPEICYQRPSKSDIYDGPWWQKITLISSLIDVLRSLKRKLKKSSWMVLLINKDELDTTYRIFFFVSESSVF